VLTPDSERGRKMMFTIEFFRIRKEDNARAMLDRQFRRKHSLEAWRRVLAEVEGRA